MRDEGRIVSRLLVHHPSTFRHKRHGLRRGPWRFSAQVVSSPQSAGNSGLFFVEWMVAVHNDRGICLRKTWNFCYRIRWLSSIRVSNRSFVKWRLGIYYLRKSVFKISLNNRPKYFSIKRLLFDKKEYKNNFLSYQSMPNLHFTKHHWVRCK